MRWMWIGLGLMFVLIGVAAVVGVAYPGTPSAAPPALYNDVFNWIWGFVGLFFAVWFFMWIFGGWGPIGWRRWGQRRYSNGGDEYQILRVRYARGEITKDQFDQMTRDLEAHERRM
jgi:uncharacterized membrane protein